MPKEPPALPTTRSGAGTPPRSRPSQGAAPVPSGVRRNTRGASAQNAQQILSGGATESQVGFSVVDDGTYRDTLAPVDEERQALSAQPAPESGDTPISPMVVRLNILWSTATFVALLIYISTSSPNSDGVPHDARGEHAWMAEVDPTLPAHVACNASYYEFARVCEPAALENADDRCRAPNDALECQVGCHYEETPAGCDWTTGVTDGNGVCTGGAGACTGCPLGCTATDTTCTGTARGDCVYDPFRVCDRSACTDHGDCVNGDDPSRATCECDDGWGGPRCDTEVSVISIGGREYGRCPLSDCADPPCASCQDVLDELLDTCVEGDVEWFHDMEDDVQLPARAVAIGCVLKGQMGERHSGETVFEDPELLPELLENFLLTSYICYALALLCEDFFVASLDIIVEKLALPPDVAGATFMAAGSSAPELFVSAAGVFITHSPVGVGACAGSTMFNTMCIIGGSALIAGKPVPLQWRSIARDCGIYLVSLVALLLMLLDGKIEGWESIVMLGLYVFYIVLCAVWGKLVKAICPISKQKLSEAADVDNDSDKLLEQAAREKYEMARMARSTASAKFKGAANQMIAIQRLQAHTDIAKSTTNLLKKEGTADIATPVAAAQRRTARQKTMTMDAAALSRVVEKAADPEHGGAHGDDGHHEHPSLCDIPKESGARLAWAISFPLMFIFTMTVPNCSKYPKVFPLTFIACIVWLGILVEMMVEHASEFGALLGFSPGILGLTLLAAGTSFPDLVASLIVAKQGSIDMAVSNAFGSNNFDILLCLGLPWMLSIYAVTGRAEVIDTSGIVIALFSLIITTVMWFGYMLAKKWVLTPGIGLTMLTTYGTWLICQLTLDLFAPAPHE